MKILVVISLAAACSGKAPDCAHAIAGGMDRIVTDAKARMKPAAAENIARLVPQMKIAITAACVDDKWGPDVIACVDRAKTQVDLDACDKMLTPDQRKSEHKRDDEILKQAIQPLAKP